MARVPFICSRAAEERAAAGDGGGGRSSRGPTFPRLPADSAGVDQICRTAVKCCGTVGIGEGGITAAAAAALRRGCSPVP